MNLSSLSEVMSEPNIDLRYVDTSEQAADIFTKALPPHKWTAALALLGIRTELPSQLEKAWLIFWHCVDISTLELL